MDITRLRRLGNAGLNALVNLVHRSRFSDLCYGYNAFWRDCLPALRLEMGEAAEEKRWGDGFEIETLINVRVHAAGLLITEVPSFERQRVHGLSNLRAFPDGLRVLRTIATERRANRGSRRRDIVPNPTEASNASVIELAAVAPASTQIGAV